MLIRMPNLTDLNLDFGYMSLRRFNDDRKSLAKKSKIKLRNLKTLKMENVYNLEMIEVITKLSEVNSLKKCSIKVDEYSEMKKGIFLDFFLNQRLIDDLEIEAQDNQEIVEGINFLNLDNLEVTLNSKILSSVIGSQLNLKTLKIINIEDPIEDDGIKSILVSKNLKSLTFKDCTFEHPKSLKFLENSNLKELKFEDESGDFGLIKAIQNLKINSVEKFHAILKIHDPNFYQEINKNFPNLKELFVDVAEHQIEFYAKSFHNLEKLEISYRNLERIFELDTGILNENLKELNLTFHFYEENFEICTLDIFEILNIFPNLEVLDVTLLDNVQIIVNKKLFKKLLELPKLKVFNLNTAIAFECLDFVEELKLISRKLEKFSVYLCLRQTFDGDHKKCDNLIENYMKKYENVEERNCLKEKSKLIEDFKKFKEILKKFYQVYSQDEISCILIKYSIDKIKIK